MNLLKRHPSRCFSSSLMVCLVPFFLAACGLSEPAPQRPGRAADNNPATAGDLSQRSDDAQKVDDTREADGAPGHPADSGVESDSSPPCQADCAGKSCGNDGCGGSCGACTGAQQVCSQGACVCQANCAGKSCGEDGCGGICGSCDTDQQYCSAAQSCVSCETGRCGVCDEIDITTIAGFSGSLGRDHGNKPLTMKVLTSWPVTSELKVAFPAGIFTAFSLKHFPGESWSTYTGGTSEGAGMVACWDKVGTGVYCLIWDWWTMQSGGYKSFDWPKGRPVAHMLFSAADKKRTAIRYFKTWPHNNPQAAYTTSTVGNGLKERSCL